MLSHTGGRGVIRILNRDRGNVCADGVLHV